MVELFQPTCPLSSLFEMFYILESAHMENGFFFRKKQDKIMP